MNCSESCVLKLCSTWERGDCESGDCQCGSVALAQQNRVQLGERTRYPWESCSQLPAGADRRFDVFEGEFRDRIDARSSCVDGTVEEEGTDIEKFSVGFGC